MKQHLLDFANQLISPTGLQLYRKGFDMKSVLKRIAADRPDIRGVLDLGAARGHWSRMAMPLFPQANFLGVEPLEERLPQLGKLTASHSRFTHIQCVVGEEDGGHIEFAVTKDLDGSFIGARPDAQTRRVDVRTVDSLVAEHGLRGPYFVKFDTHGFEVPIIAGAEKTLSETPYLVMEVYNFRHTSQTLYFYEMCDMLAKLGFRCCNMADPLQRPTDSALWQMDLFFAREDNTMFTKNTYRAV